MKRKGLIVGAIVLGVLALLLVFAVTAAPLLVRLGLEPVCIQGNLPDIKIVPCPSEESALPPGTPITLPTPSGQAPRPLIVDDDGSPDGMVALLYFLNNPLFDVRAVTVSYGEAHPDVFAPRLQQLLAMVGREEIPVGAGSSTPLGGENSFPEEWRAASDDFWGLALSKAQGLPEPVPAAELIVQTLRESPEPVMVFVSGSHTNLAEALRRDPGVADNIHSVVSMGGGLYVPGNIASDWPAIQNEAAEWNIWVDPQAASEVFAAGQSLHLIPLDATRQVTFTEADREAWAASGTPEGGWAAELLAWMLESWSAEDIMIWDLVAAAQATDPALCPEAALSVEIVLTPGPEQGQTRVVEGVPNVAACLEPDAVRLKALVAAVFSR